MTEILELLRRRMEENGLSQADVASRAGLSASTLSRLLDGKTQNPHRSTIERIQSAIEAEVRRVPVAAAIHPNANQRLALHKQFVQTWARQFSFRDLSSPRDLSDSYIDLQITAPSINAGAEVATISDILQTAGNFVVLGSAGAGKTTSLKYLALRALHSDSRKESSLPLVVLLKTLDKDEEGLFDALSSVLGISVTSASGSDRGFTSLDRKLEIVQALSAKKALILLDGLDEVNPNKRDLVVEDVRFLVYHAQDFRVVLTCRSGAYRYHLENAKEVEIASLASEQLVSFVSAWFSEDRAKEFVHQLGQTPFADTAQRPLTIAHLCAIYERSGSLPDRPRTVYRKVVNLLLEEWDEQRSVRRYSQYGDLPVDRKADLLQAIAYHLVRTSRQWSFARMELESACRSVFPALSLPPADAPAVARELEEHSGLLVEVQDGRYEFAHKSIQDYLVANYLLALPQLPSNVLVELPQETAVAVAMSSAPTEYFLALIGALSIEPESTIWSSAVAAHLVRLKVEQPDFIPSADLGWSLLVLHSFGSMNGDQALCDAVELLVWSSIAKESVRAALSVAHVEPTDASSLLIPAPFEADHMLAGFLPRGKSVRVDSKFLPLLK